MEKLRYIEVRAPLNPGTGTVMLVIQLDGGGACESFSRNDPAELVIAKLRELANRIEDGCKARKRS